MVEFSSHSPFYFSFGNRVFVLSFVELFLQKRIHLGPRGRSAVEKMIILSTQIFSEEGDNIQILNEGAPGDGGRRRRVEPRRVSEVAMRAVLDVHPIGVARQPIE